MITESNQYAQEPENVIIYNNHTLRAPRVLTIFSIHTAASKQQIKNLYFICTLISYKIF